MTASPIAAGASEGASTGRKVGYAPVFELTATPLARSPIGLFASPDLDLSAWDLDGNPGLAAGLPLLRYASELGFLEDAPWFHALAAVADVRLVSNSTHVLVAAAGSGLGVAVLPSFVAAAAGLVPATTRTVTHHDLYVVGHPEFRREPKIAAVAAFLKQEGPALAGPPLTSWRPSPSARRPRGAPRTRSPGPRRSARTPS